MADLAPTPRDWAEAVREARSSDPHLSIDDRPEIILTLGGAYVAAWVWIPRPTGVEQNRANAIAHPQASAPLMAADLKIVNA